MLALALLLGACASPSIPVTQEFLADREGRIDRALAKARGEPVAPAPQEFSESRAFLGALGFSGGAGGTISTGYTKAQVRERLGYPCETYTSTSAGMTIESWEYCAFNGSFTETTNTVVFVNGRVDTIYDF